MNGFCPICEEEREITVSSRAVEYIVRGESIRVEAPVARCSACAGEFEAPNSDIDPLEKAYDEYRRRHGLLSPGDIRRFRHSIGLTQKELSTLLGWGGITLARYENGALQDQAHDRALRLSMQPESLVMLLDQSPGVLPKAKEQALRSRLAERLAIRQTSLLDLLEDIFTQHRPDEYSGYRSFDLDKLVNAILFFCRKGQVFKTKLNKLLFYADFKHFKEYSVSITGARYAHLPYGPAPHKYASVIAALTEEYGALAASERTSGRYAGEVLEAVKPPDLAVFEPSETKVLELVDERFAKMTAKQLSDLSHSEEGFLKTRDGEPISYVYAESLSI